MAKKPEIRISLNILFAILCFLSGQHGFATTYYVSHSGDDAQPGTSATAAWATIGKVNSTEFLPGDTLYFEGGETFSGSIFLSATEANDPDRLFVISSYGTGRATINAGNSYGFYAYNTQGFSISNLIIDGNSVTSNAGTGLMIFADLPGDLKFSNISVSDLEIKNFGGEGVKIYSANKLTGFQNLSLTNLSVHDVTQNGIEISGDVSNSMVGWPHRNVSVSHCEVYHVPGSPAPATLQGNGIVLAGVDGGTVAYCVAHDNGQNNGVCGGPGGIWSLESNNVVIRYCESYRNHSGSGCDGLGFDLDGGMNNSILEYNYSHDNDGAGYLLGQYQNARPWNNNTVRYNISENDGVLNEGGIGLFKGPGTTMNGANIYNNCIYVSPQAGNPAVTAAYIKEWTMGINNVAFYNNIFMTSGNTPFVSIPAGYSAFFGENIYWNTNNAFSIQYQGASYSSLDAWRNATGNEIVNAAHTGFDIDPLLSNAGAGGTVGFGNSLASLNAYKIRSVLSPAYHSALDLQSLFSIDIGNNDFWGTTVSPGADNDIGSNQFTSILPARLLSFHGNCSGAENEISWTTSEEENMKSFDVLFSVDAVHFILLSEVKPKGSNSVYAFVNDSAVSENNFYQLKMIDLDGTVTYSPVVNVHCSGIGNSTIASPNPFDRSFNLSTNAKTSGPANMSLFDALGNLVLQKAVQLQEGRNLIPFEGLDELPTGPYYLKISGQQGVREIKLLKLLK